MLCTWDEYYAQHKADALRLLGNVETLFGAQRAFAYGNIKKHPNLKEKRLVDLAAILRGESDMKRNVDSAPIVILTEGDLGAFETILDELW